MKIICRTAMKGLRLNKRRTRNTLLGIVLTAALFGLAASFLWAYDCMIRDEIIARTGNWHVKFGAVPSENIKIITGDRNTAAYRIEQTFRIYSEQAPNIDLIKADSEMLEGEGLELVSGRLPNTPGELAVTEAYAAAYPPGEEIQVVLTQHEGEGSVFAEEGETKYYKITDAVFRVVGVLKTEQKSRQKLPSADAYAVFDGGKDLLPGSYSTVYTACYRVFGGVSDWAKQMAESADVPYEMDPIEGKLFPVFYNQELLMTYGVMDRDVETQMVAGMTALLVLVVAFAGSALIYSTFSISVTEKTKFLGMLSSIGATRQQRKKLIFCEAGVYAVVGIPIGLIMSFGIMVLISGGLNTLLHAAMGERFILVPSFPWEVAAAAAGLSVAVVFLSSLVPARRAGKLPPLSAILQTRDIKLPRKRIRPHTFVLRVFGLPALLGIRQIERNRRRFRATTVGLAVSIALALGVSSFLFYSTEAYRMTQNSAGFDVEVLSAGLISDKLEAAREKEKQVQIDRAVRTTSVPAFVAVQRDQLQPWVLDDHKISKDLLTEYIMLITLDEQSLDELCRSLGLQKPGLDGETPTGILLNTVVQWEAGGRLAEKEYFRFREGDMVPLFSNTEAEKPDMEVIVTQVSSGKADWMNKGSCYLVVSEEAMRRMHYDFSNLQSTNCYYWTKDHKELTDAFIKDVQATGLHPLDRAEYENQQRQMQTAVAGGGYGFVGVIALLCILNLHGMLVADLQLRSKEFALLKCQGMTMKDLRRMTAFESLWYSVRTLLIALPGGFCVNAAVYYIMQGAYGMAFRWPWQAYLLAAVIVPVLILVFMLSAARRNRIMTPAEGLRTE